jgi:hypothetical protein
MELAILIFVALREDGRVDGEVRKRQRIHETLPEITCWAASPLRFATFGGKPCIS